MTARRMIASIAVAAALVAGTATPAHAVFTDPEHSECRTTWISNVVKRVQCGPLVRVYHRNVRTGELRLIRTTWMR